MSLRAALLSLGLLIPGWLPADTIQFVIHAVDAAAADLFPADVTTDEAKLIAHLQTLKGEGKAITALEFGGEFQPAASTDFSEGEDLETFVAFAAEGEKLKPDKRVPRFLGYKATLRALLEKDGSSRIQLSFEWSPTFEKVAIPRGGDDAWLPVVHTIKSETTTSASPGQPFLAACWRTSIPLNPKDRGASRQLYLVGTWTTTPAN